MNFLAAKLLFAYFTGTTYTVLATDITNVGVYHGAKAVVLPQSVAITYSSQSFSASYNQKACWGDADDAGPWHSIVAHLSATVTGTVSSSFTGTVAAGEVLYLYYDTDGQDAFQMIRRTSPGTPTDADPNPLDVVTLLVRRGYTRTGTFVNFSHF